MPSEIIGMDLTLRAMQKYADEITPAVHEAMGEFMRMILDRSKELCPKDTLDLVESATLDEGPGENDWTAKYRQEYAIYVHEMPEEFNFTTPGTGPKYLSRAVEELKPRAREIIGPEAWKKFVRRVGGSGTGVGQPGGFPVAVNEAGEFVPPGGG